MRLMSELFTRVIEKKQKVKEEISVSNNYIKNIY
jgi:hypothetical protein